MKGTIDIKGLVLFAKHGVHDAEAKLGQRFTLDIALEIEIDEAIQKDRIEATVDYGEAIAVSERAFREKRFFLIEAAAAHVAGVLLAHFPKVKFVRITVRKPSAPVPAAIDYVAATVERKRDA